MDTLHWRSATDFDRYRVDPETVAILDWPEQADRAAELARWYAPRLLLVAPGAEPPREWDLSSDWLRRPAHPRDVMLRVDALERRAAGGGGAVRLDEDGLLWRGRRWVALPPTEMRIIAHFLENAQRVVRRSELEQAAWPNETRRPRSLDARLHRLRTRIAPLGLGVKSIRQRGFLFAVAEI